MICSKCSTESKDDAQFCHKCGNALFLDNGTKKSKTWNKSIVITSIVSFIIFLIFVFFAINIQPPATISIAGLATQNQILTANSNLIDHDNNRVVTYQWQESHDGVNWNDINAGNSITLKDAQVGKKVRVIANYTDEQGVAKSIISQTTTTIANVDEPTTGDASITGTVVQNQILTASNTFADNDGLGDVSYQWQESPDGTMWNNVSVGSTFSLSERQVGKQIRVIAKHIDKQGSSENINSPPTSPVANINDSLTGGVSIAGTIAQNQTLTASNSLADDDGLGDISYQWQSSSDGTTWIDIGKGLNFAPSDVEVGKQIRVIANYTDGHGTIENGISPPTVAVLATDENLFLIRLLETIYTQRPELNSNSNIGSIHKWIKDTRDILSSIQGHIAGKPNEIDQRINSLYENCIKFLTAYEAFILEISSIQSFSFNNSNDNSVPNSVGSLATQVAATLISAPVAVATNAVIAINDLMEKNKVNTEVESKKVEAIKLRADALNSQYQAAFNSTKSLVNELKTDKKYQWGAEAGFDDSLLAGVSLTEQSKLRPRDPFVFFQMAQKDLQDNRQEKNLPESRLKQTSENTYKAATNLIPKHDVYKPYKAGLIFLAAELALEAATKQLNGYYSNAPVSYAKYAIELYGKYLDIVPSGDGSKYEYVQLARALAMNKDFNKAIKMANVAADEYKWKNDKIFCYRYARLMSLTNNIDLVSGWLKDAYRLGYSDIQFVRNDNDLKIFRDNKPDEFNYLTTVNKDVSIKYGNFNDDIFLENKSPFPLTNVHLTGQIKQDDTGLEWSLDLSADNVDPQYQYKWSDAVSVKNSRFDLFEYQLSCDQC
jgi:hypothetical protein